MRKILFFIIGLAVALLAEFWRFVIVLHQSIDWILLILGYIVFLLIAYFLIKPIKSNLVYYLALAVFGVVVYEILLLNVLPQILAAGIIGWITWLSFWGSVALIPRLFIKKEIKKFTIFFFFGSLIFFLGMQFITNNPGSMGLFYASLNIAYFLQFKEELKAQRGN